MSFEASMRVSFAEQLAFAEISGDRNPIHVDRQAARRLFYGQPVVHGLHVAVAALDKVLEAWPDVVRVERLRARFVKPVFLDQEVTIAARRSAEGKVTARVTSAEGTHAEILVFVGADAPRVACERGELEAGAVVERSIDDLEGDQGELPLSLHVERFAAAFPVLGEKLDAGVAAVLLGTTRLVGMACPGLHSLFAGLDLAFDDGDPECPERVMRYEVARIDRRFNAADIRVTGRGFRGTLNVFVRPAPVRQVSMEHLAGLVAEPVFDRQKALVVGGSRGLGEVTAKLLSAGGADVTLTYASGSRDAERVVGEIEARGGTARSAPYDALAAHAAVPEGAFSHVYYFASPRITPGARTPFDVELFDRYRAFFVDGLARLAAALADPVLIFYPSTVFLDTSEKGFVEYAAAKAAGETLCRYLESARGGLTTHIVRLPRMRTDQTQTIFARQAADLAEPAEVLLSVLEVAATHGPRGETSIVRDGS